MSQFVPMSRGLMSPRQIVQAWVTRFNAGDADAIVELYHEDALANLSGDAPVAGKRRIRRSFEKKFRRSGPPRLTETIYGLDSKVVLEWRDLDGNCGSEFFSIDGGKIVSSGLRPGAERPTRWLRRLLSVFTRS